MNEGDVIINFGKNHSLLIITDKYYKRVMQLYKNHQIRWNIKSD